MLRCHVEAHALIDALAQSVHDGALVILGDVGSGKSALLAAVWERFAETASLVRVNRGESGWPLSGVSAIGGGGAGLDVSPALTGCLGFPELDGITPGLSWRFVEESEVPPGPWTRLVTTSGVR